MVDPNEIIYLITQTHARNFHEYSGPANTRATPAWFDPRYWNPDPSVVLSPDRFSMASILRSGNGDLEGESTRRRHVLTPPHNHRRHALLSHNPKRYTSGLIDHHRCTPTPIRVDGGCPVHVLIGNHGAPHRMRMDPYLSLPRPMCIHIDAPLSSPAFENNRNERGSWSDLLSIHGHEFRS